MRRKPEFYARAFLETAEHAPESKLEALVKIFLEIIRKNGDWSGLNKIFKVVQSMTVKKAGGHIVKIETARHVPNELSENLKKCFQEHDLLELAINPDLVAGVKILIDEEKELDFSLKRKLQKLFVNT